MRSSSGDRVPVQVIIQQARGNSAAMISLFCVLLGVLTCCLPIIPWVFAVLGIGFALLGILVAFTRGGAGLGYALAALLLSFLPLLPIFLIGGVFFVAPAVNAARDAAKRAAENEAVTPAKSVADRKPLPELQPVSESKRPVADSAADPSPSRSADPSTASDKKSPDATDSIAPEPSPPDTPPPIVNANLRTWTDASGEHEIEAEFVSMTAGKVKLKKADGTIVTLPMDKLSEDDRKWIRKRGR